MASFARWCFIHRKAVLAGWLVALIGFFALGKLAGTAYTNSYTLPGTDSAKAQQVLTADFPALAGDSEQIVVQARNGTLRDQAAESAVTAMLAKVARLPYVGAVTSPYSQAGQISKDGTIGLATVNLTTQAQNVPNAAVTKLVDTAKSADGPLLNVQLGGTAIENVATSSGDSTSVVLGIVAALVVLFFAFRRSVYGAVLPLISALVAIGAGTSIIAILTHVIAVASWVPQVAILVALGVGVDYALFIVSRHRTGLLAGQAPEDAAITALTTSGRAVLLAGLTVCAALLGLFALGVGFLYGVAVTVTLVVGLTMLASLTLLPAMLGFLGLKVLRRAERETGHRVEDSTGFWLRWAEGIGRKPQFPALLALAVTVVLAIPFLSMRAGLLDSSTDPSASTTYQAYQLLAKGFGPGFNGPLELIGQVSSPADRARFTAFTTAARGQPDVTAVLPPQLSPNGKAVIAAVYPATGPQDAATTTLLDRLRAAIPKATAGSTLAIHIGGTTAASEDFSQVLNSKLPQFVAVVVGLAFLLLAIVFRSLLIPLVAAVMNLLSFGVALGVMTAVFQFGWGKSVIGFSTTGPIESWIPALMFAILFGLSTDYEVFLISRMHEEWARTGDNRRAVIRGQAQTGRVITAASLIMILVFASFIAGGLLPIQQIGLGFAAAIFVDAYIIRTVLVPAVMHMLGRANWWLPSWLDRHLPRFDVEPAQLPSPETLRQPVSPKPVSPKPVGPKPARP
ncbi:MAG TPA: MMPL family transporter [Streptosporangiaceae bacterium]|nr:MMPL family transporter [Streptosporangiaceae bacterium]